MSDVALRAGLGKGTIYLHFSDKAALFDAVVREVALRTRAQRALPRPRPNEPTRDFLRRVVPPLLGLFRDSGLSRVILLVASEGARLPEVADVYRQVIIDPVLRIVVLYAGRAERRGELRAGPLSRHPLIMVAPVVVTTLYNTLFAGGAPVDVLATFDDFLDLLFAAGTKSPGLTGRHRGCGTAFRAASRQLHEARLLKAQSEPSTAGAKACITSRRWPPTTTAPWRMTASWTTRRSRRCSG